MPDNSKLDSMTFDLVFDPGSDRKITRREYQEGRRFARLARGLNPSGVHAARTVARWAELVQLLPLDVDAQARARLEEMARDLGLRTPFSALQHFERIVFHERERWADGRPRVLSSRLLSTPTE